MAEAPNSARDAWVDYAKGIGILLVVYGHVARGVYNAGIPMDAALYERVDSIIYTFHMPLFFFLSGIFFVHSLQRRGPLSLVANKLDTILYPYLLWSLLQGLIEVSLSSATTSNTTITEVLTLWRPRVQFWFLYALFLVMLVAILVYRRTGTSVILGALGISALAYVYQDTVPSALSSHLVINNFVFFALGVWFNTVKERIADNPVPWACVGLLAFGAGQYLFHVQLGLVYSDKGLASLLLAVVAIIAISALCMALARRPLGWMMALGSASMTIYLMHILAGSGARIILERLLGVQDAAVHLILGCLAGVLLPILAVRLFQQVGGHWLFKPPRWLSVEALYRRGPSRTTA